jgi:hypothetical protein
VPSTIVKTSFQRKRISILIFQIEKLVPFNFSIIGFLISKEEVNTYNTELAIFALSQVHCSTPVLVPKYQACQGKAMKICENFDKLVALCENFTPLNL